ncbi:germinal-center associated nuclear protein-like [Oppia nitens]|uniref:germinal-center associated nuclear protein-like n=1 Tax=Oppia nitens TaxID=1686743 RepID=UPI0023DA6153|nr:germinal-center associated nuclear protein-like [Oppia nitens]
MMNGRCNKKSAAMKPIVGLCMDMCPPNEIKWREDKGLLHEFEMTKESEIIAYREKTNREKQSFRPKADKRKIVKQFSRSSAGQPMQSPAELRPIKVLVKTCDYLLSKVISIETVNWNLVYDYVFDRLRAVRQDMSIQQSEDILCLTVLEQCVRFHIYSDYYFGDEEVRLYDRHINDTHLRECLQSLLKRYDRLVDVSDARNRPLFETIYLLYNMDSDDALSRYGTLPAELKKHRLVLTAFHIVVNYKKKFFYPIIQSLITLKPPIISLLASISLPKLHAMAIKVLSVGYSSPNTQFPIETLRHWLCPFETNAQKADKYLYQLCQYYGLSVTDGTVAFNKSKFTEQSKTMSQQKWSSFEFIISEVTLSSLVRGRHENISLEE